MTLAGLFSELLFGSGFWFSVIFLSAIIVLMAKRSKESALIFLPFAILLSIKWFENVTPTDLEFYGVIVFMAIPTFITLELIYSKFKN